jgi:hypothetical protein
MGFVTAEVDRVSVRGPTGPLDMHLGDIWAPDAADVGSLRPFVAFEQGEPAIVDPHSYLVQVQAGQRRVTEIRP